MLCTVVLGGGQVAAGDQVFVYPYSALVFATATKKIAQGKVQLGGVRVVLHCFNEGVNRLVLLLVEQEVQTAKVGFGGLPVFNAELPQIQPGGQPAQRKGQRKSH